MFVFMGLWIPYEVPIILERYGLIDEFTAEILADRTLEPQDDPDVVLLPLLQQCYRRGLKLVCGLN
jgi:hypothetical protein